MNVRKVAVFALLSLFSVVIAVRAEDLEQIESETAQRVAEHLSKKFLEETKEPQVKFEVDPMKAVGLHSGHDGIVMVPIKGLKEGEINPAVESENGAGLCYLFCSQCFNPMVGDKPAEADKLRKLKFTDGEGNDREATCLLVTAKHVAGDEWKLLVFGSDKKPLIESDWSESGESKEGDLAMHVKDAKDNKAKLVFTLYNKYSSSIPIAHK